MESSEHTSQNARHEKDTQKAQKHPWPLRSLLAVMAMQCGGVAILWHLEPHPISRNTLLAGQRGGILAFTLFYTLLVTRIGPALMRHRKPMELRTALYVYNVLQIFSNAYIFLGVYAGNLFLWSKVSDLMDTVFFVLRKKDKQVSFLHVYHHAMMVLLAWHGLELHAGGGHGVYLGLYNTLMHTVMYTYYLYSLINPGNIWWKKYITLLQIIHQAAILLHLGLPLIHNPCNHPVLGISLLIAQGFFLIYMFTRFYYTTYIRITPVKTQ